MDSDLLAIRSAPADVVGYHAPFRWREYDEDGTCDCEFWVLPEYATLTLEEVHEPGEWLVRGLAVQRRLFVASMSYG